MVGSGLQMTGCVFKRKRDRSVSWCYVFFGGWDANEKRIQIGKVGFPTKDAASKAVRILKGGFQDRVEAESALRLAIARRDAKKRKQAEDDAERPGPPFTQFFEHWLKEHASRRWAPKAMERYAELGAYLVRELGETPLNVLTTAQIQEAIHHVQDHGG